MAQPNNILSGKGCANCRNLQTSKRCRKSHAQFVSEMSNVDDSIIVLGSYITAKTPILCQCAVCGHRWRPTPSNLLSGYGCTICKHKQVGLKKRKTHEQFVKEVYGLNSNLSIESEYIDSKTQIYIHCKRCGANFVRTPDALLSSHGYCAGCMGSHGEQRISQWLTQHSIYFESQKRFNDLKGPGGDTYHMIFISLLKIYSLSIRASIMMAMGDIKQIKHIIDKYYTITSKQIMRRSTRSIYLRSGTIIYIIYHLFLKNISHTSRNDHSLSGDARRTPLSCVCRMKI